MRKLLAFLCILSLICFVSCAEPGFEEPQTFDESKVEATSISETPLENVSEISDLICRSGNCLVYQCLSEDSIVIAKYSPMEKKERVLYASDSVFALSNVEVFRGDLLFCETFENKGIGQNPMKFSCVRVSEGTKGEMFSDECIKIPSIAKGGNNCCYINYQKIEGEYLKSFVVRVGINAESEISSISTARAQIDGNGAMTGYVLIGISAFKDFCYFQKIRLDGVSEFEKATEAEIVEVDSNNEAVIHRIERLLLYMGASDKHFLGSDYYYDLPDGEVKTSWVAEKDFSKRQYLPNTFVSKEITNAFWVSSDKVIAQNHSTVYEADFSQNRVVYWDISSEYGENHTKAVFDNNSYYIIYCKDGKYSVVECRDLQLIDVGLSQTPIENQESISYQVLIDDWPLPKNGVTYVQEENISLAFVETMKVMEPRDEDFLSGHLEDHILEINGEWERTSFDGTVTGAVVYSIKNITRGSVVTVAITEELAGKLGLETTQIKIIRE